MSKHSVESHSNLESNAQIGGYLKKLELAYQAVKSQEGKPPESRIEEGALGGWK